MNELHGGNPLEEAKATEKIDTGLEQESNPEQEKIFKAAIVLGAGTKPDRHGGMTGLTFDAKLRVLTGGTIASEGRTERLILAGGKTAGPENPSEAEVMRMYLLKKFPGLADFPITIEDASFDTIENARNVAKSLIEDENSEVLLITNNYHMIRASNNFRNQGLEVEEVPAEKNILERNSAPRIKTGRDSAYEKLIQQYLQSCDMKKKSIIEAALRGITKIDPEGKLLTTLAKMMRHGKEEEE